MLSIQCLSPLPSAHQEHQALRPIPKGVGLLLLRGKSRCSIFLRNLVLGRVAYDGTVPAGIGQIDVGRSGSDHARVAGSRRLSSGRSVLAHTCLPPGSARGLMTLRSGEGPSRGSGPCRPQHLQQEGRVLPERTARAHRDPGRLGARSSDFLRASGSPGAIHFLSGSSLASGHAARASFHRIHFFSSLRTAWAADASQCGTPLHGAVFSFRCGLTVPAYPGWRSPQRGTRTSYQSIRHFPDLLAEGCRASVRYLARRRKHKMGPDARCEEL